MPLVFKENEQSAQRQGELSSAWWVFPENLNCKEVREVARRSPGETKAVQMRCCYLGVSCPRCLAWDAAIITKGSCPAETDSAGSTVLEGSQRRVGAHVIFRQGASESYTPPHLPHWVPASLGRPRRAAILSTHSVHIEHMVGQKCP